MDWRAPALETTLQALLKEAQGFGLGANLNGVCVQVVGQTGSTNTDLLDWGRSPSGAGQGGRDRVQVLLAESQTAGRGRQGRAWMAEAGASLTFSLALPMRPQPGWGALSLVVGHALAQALQPWGPAGPVEPAPGWLMLKWPNDLWWVDGAPSAAKARAQGRKLAGVLIETLPLSTANGHDGTRWVVVGVGMNIRPPVLDTQGLPPGGVAGTSLCRPGEDAVAIWHRVAPALLRALLTFEVQGFDHLRPLIEARDLLVGQTVSLSAGPVPSGLCVGIDADGALRVQGPQGPVRVVAGEAQVRPQ